MHPAQFDNMSSGGGFLRDFHILNLSGLALAATGAQVTTGTVPALGGATLKYAFWDATETAKVASQFRVPGDFDHQALSMTGVKRSKLRAHLNVLGLNVGGSLRLTCDIYRTRPGASVETLATGVLSSVFAAQATSQEVTIDLDGYDIKAGDIVTLQFAPTGNGSDAVNFYGGTIRGSSNLALTSESARRV